jgi:hypothetical protein
MDIVIIMFGSVIAVMTALTFLEVRRIRKLSESKKADSPLRQQLPSEPRTAPLNSV